MINHEILTILNDINYKLYKIQKTLDKYHLNNKNSFKLLSNKQASKLLNVCVHTLTSYRNKGILPYNKINNQIFYDPVHINRLIKK